MMARDFDSFIVTMAVLGAGYSFNSCYANPTVIEMHGENGVSLMFGLEMLVYGLGATTAPPLAGKYLPLLSAYCIHYSAETRAECGFPEVFFTHRHTHG